MRIAHYQLGSNTKKPMRGFTLLIVLLLIAPLTTLWAQEAAEPIEVSAANVEVSDGGVVIDLALSHSTGVRMFNLTSPARLVFDIDNAVLTFEPDAATSWATPMSGIANLTIVQFSMEPPVVRIMAEVTDGSLQADRISDPDGLRLAVYRGESPFAESGPGDPPGHMSPTIERFWHEPIENGKDRFVIDFSFGVVLPQIRIESATVLLIKFPATDVLLPASNPENYATRVDGNVTERMRTERVSSGDETTTEIRLTVDDTSTLGYTLETRSDNSLELILFIERQPERPIAVEPESVPLDSGRVMVLASEEDTPVQPDAPIQIHRVQFQSIDDSTDRFYVFYEGGDLKPNIQRFNYPTRIAMYFANASIVLADSVDGRFQTVVSGVLANELKVYNRVIEDVGSECQFMFYFPSCEQDIIGYNIDYVEVGLIHIDFFQASTPINFENLVEVNTSIDAPAPELAAIPEVIEPIASPEIEQVAEPAEVIEPIEETEYVESPELDEIAEIVEETEPIIDESNVAIGEEPEIGTPPSIPRIEVTQDEVTDDVISFIIKTSEILPMPEWVEYRYPDRLGLKFPLAEVVLLGHENAFTTYTHIKPIPLIRTIVKDQDDEQYTTITFTLNGLLEEFDGELDWNGNEMRVAFRHTPIMPEPEVPAPVAPPEYELAPEPETDTTPQDQEIPVVVEIEVEGSTEAGVEPAEDTEPAVEPEEIEAPAEEPEEVEISNEEPENTEPAVEPEEIEIPVVEPEEIEAPAEEPEEVEISNEEPEEFEYPAVEPEEIEIPLEEPVETESLEEAVPEPVEDIEFPEATVAPEPVEPELVAQAEIEIELVDEVIVVQEPDIEVEETDIAEIQAHSFSVDEWVDDFGGTFITDITFESAGEADILRLSTTGRIQDWEVSPLNYPTKLVARLPNARPVAQNGDLLNYDERITGGLVDEYSANATVSLDTSFTILKVYTHDVESTELLAYDVRDTGNEWALAIYPAGGKSPFETEGTSQVILEQTETQEEQVEFAEPEYGGFQLEPIRVMEDLEAEIGDEEVDIDSVSISEPRIDMALEDANVRDVLQLVAQQANLNISIDSSVAGKITISVTDIGLKDLLELLGAQMGFTYFIQHGVYIFGDSSVLQSRFGTVWPRWFISLSYADPDQIRGILVSMQVLGSNQIQIYRGTFGSTGVIIASPVMILTGEERDLKRAYRIIAAVDQPPKMIQVDFQILNTSLTDNENLGFDFNFGTGTGMTQLTFTEQVSQNPDMGPLPQGFDRMRAGLENTYNINFIANYLVENGYAELKNRSSLTVANNQTGTLFVGENIPYRSTYQVSELGRVTQRVATQSVGLQLNFRPHANPDGTVTLYLAPSNSNLLELTDVGPRTVDQRFSTTVRVKDGEPFIVGGFIRDEERVRIDRFPLLSELPLLGHLFRNREVKNTRSELIFIGTPHIINPRQHLPEIWTDEHYDVPLPLDGNDY